MITNNILNVQYGSKGAKEVISKLVKAIKQVDEDGYLILNTSKYIRRSCLLTSIKIDQKNCLVTLYYDSSMKGLDDDKCFHLSDEGILLDGPDLPKNNYEKEEALRRIENAENEIRAAKQQIEEME